MPHSISPIRIRAVLRAFAFALFVSLAVCAGAVEAADARTYASALASGKSKLEAGQLDAALRDFQQAVQADASQYEGYFYLAVASFRSGNHAAALEYGNAAVAAASEQEKTRAQELVDAIRKAKETEDLARAGDEAQGKGLIAKAADLYARAFQLSPDRGDIGLKAATLYGNRLGRLLDAAVIYQGVIASGDAAAANTAGAELGSLHEPLQEIYQKELARAARTGDVRTVEKICKAFPNEAAPRLEVATIQAGEFDGAAVATWLGEAVKLGTSYDDVKARDRFLDLWEEDVPAFKAFIGDAFGPAAVADMDQRLQARQARLAAEEAAAQEQVRLDAIARERKQREEEKRQHEQQLARELVAREAASRPLRARLRAPVVAELNRLFQAAPDKRVPFKKTIYDVGATWDTTIGLEGDSYVMTYAYIMHRGSRFNYKDTPSVTVYRIDSLATMTSATMNLDHWARAPDMPKETRRRADNLRNLKLGFSAQVVRSTTECLGKTESSTSYAVYATFMLQNPADGDRIVALVWQLKAIDSFSLEQLREKTGGG